MMKLLVEARARIICPRRKNLDDIGLLALDGLRSFITYVKELDDAIEVIEQFMEDHPETMSWDFTVMPLKT